MPARPGHARAAQGNAPHLRLSMFVERQERPVSRPELLGADAVTQLAPETLRDKSGASSSPE